jgi:hypothetical protein
MDGLAAMHSLLALGPAFSLIANENDGASEPK